MRISLVRSVIVKSFEEGALFAKEGLGNISKRKECEAEERKLYCIKGMAGIKGMLEQPSSEDKGRLREKGREVGGAVPSEVFDIGRKRKRKERRTTAVCGPLA